MATQVQQMRFENVLLLTNKSLRELVGNRNQSRKFWAVVSILFEKLHLKCLDQQADGCKNVSSMAMKNQILKMKNKRAIKTVKTPLHRVSLLRPHAGNPFSNLIVTDNWYFHYSVTRNVPFTANYLSYQHNFFFVLFSMNVGTLWMCQITVTAIVI